ncbi:unnamed protein product, partial [Allacma fusca]
MKRSFQKTIIATKQKIQELDSVAAGLVTTICSIEANSVRKINFSLESTDQWGRMGGVLSMPAEVRRQNNDGGSYSYSVLTTTWS